MMVQDFFGELNVELDKQITSFKLIDRNQTSESVLQQFTCNSSWHSLSRQDYASLRCNISVWGQSQNSSVKSFNGKWHG